MSVKSLLTSFVGGFSGGTYWILEITPSQSLNSITLDNTDNIYATLQEDAFSNASYFKVSALGILQWVKRIITDTIIHVDYNSSTSNIYLDYITSGENLLWTNTSGVLQSQITFEYPKYISNLTSDTSGNLYAAAYDSLGTNNPGVIKHNSSGVIQWLKYLTVSGNDSLSIDKSYADAAGNLYTTAINFHTSGTIHRHLFKYNTSGTLQWQRKVSSPTLNFYNADVVADTSGNVYMAVTTEDSLSSLGALLLVKYNSTGTLQWQRQYDNFGTNFVKCTVDSAGNIYIIGSEAVSGLGFLVIKYNTSGTLQWQREVVRNDISIYPSLTDFSIDTAGNSLILALNSNNSTIGSLIVKLPTNGSITGTFGNYTISTATHSTTTVTYGFSTTTFTVSNGSIDATSSAGISLSNSSLITLGTTLY